jgi:hypothetical protein
LLQLLLAYLLQHSRACSHSSVVATWQQQQQQAACSQSSKTAQQLVYSQAKGPTLTCLPCIHRNGTSCDLSIIIIIIINKKLGHSIYHSLPSTTELAASLGPA